MLLEGSFLAGFPLRGSLLPIKNVMMLVLWRSVFSAAPVTPFTSELWIYLYLGQV